MISLKFRLPYWTFGVAWVLMTSGGLAHAAIITCAADGTTCSSPPYSGCGGLNCTAICADPAANGYSAFGAPRVIDNCGAMVCEQDYSDSTLITITPSVGTGSGSLSPGVAQTISVGQNVSFTATPNAGYLFSSFSGTSCAGTQNLNVYTASPGANCTVVANFVQTYTVSTTVSGGGSINPTSTTTEVNKDAKFTLSPNAGYGIVSGTGCGGHFVGTPPSYWTGAITGPCTVAITFGPLVSTSAAIGSKFSATSTAVAAGTSTTLTLTALSGYTVTGATGCGGTLSGTTYTTGAVNAPCTVTSTVTGSPSGNIACNSWGYDSNCDEGTDPCTGADCTDYCINPAAYGFTLTGTTATPSGIYYNCTANWSIGGGGTTYTVTPSVYGGGTISPNTGQSVSAGGTKQFTLTPNAGYAIYNVTGTCGGSLSGSTFTTNAVNANCTVIGNFAAGTDGYRLNSGQEIMINAHTVCKKITNNNASAIFIPTKSAAEWSQFLTNAPGITQANCP